MLEDILEWLELDPSSPSGLVWAKDKPHSSYKKGSPALKSKTSAGYFAGMLCHRNVLAHRAVYALAYGYLPDVVDHVDGNRGNNSPSNLRAADAVINQHNRRTAKGYYETPAGSFRVMIKADGIHHLVGTFKTKEDARAAYLRAKNIYHPTSPIKD